MHFEQTEYEQRLNNTRKAMDKAGISLLLVSDPSNIAWLTGYDGWSFYTHQCAVVSMTGQPVWWGRGMDALGALRTVYMDEANVVGYEDIYVQNPDKHPMQTLASLISERAWDTRCIGVELDNYYYSAAAHQTLIGAFPDQEITDATGLVNWQRAVKSDTEILYMRKAARIVEHMHQRFLNAPSPVCKSPD